MAFGKDTIGLAGGAVSDLFSSQGYKSKAKGDRFEAERYRHAGDLADQNARFAQESTAIQSFQNERQVYQGLGGIEASVGGSGLSESGSALDILRSSAQQGALQDALLKRQGLITEQGYKEQASSYRDMAGAADRAAHDADKAGDNALITGAIKGVGALLTLA